MLEQLAVDGVMDVCVHCPGFVADNIENITETVGDHMTLFTTRAPEGAIYTFVPALNTSPGLIEAIVNAIEEAIPEETGF